MLMHIIKFQAPTPRYIRTIPALGWVSLLILPILLTGCGGKAEQVREMEKKILAEFNQQVGKTVKSVVCPESVQTSTDKAAECIGELESGKGFAIAVKHPDPKGNFQWDMPSIKGIVNLDQLKNEIQIGLKTEKLEGDLDCGAGKYKAASPGSSFECQFTPAKSGQGADQKDPGKAGEASVGKGGQTLAKDAQKPSADAKEGDENSLEKKNSEAKSAEEKNAEEKGADLKSSDSKAEDASPVGASGENSDAKKKTESSVQSDSAAASSEKSAAAPDAGQNDGAKNDGAKTDSKPNQTAEKSEGKGGGPKPVPQKILISLDTAGNISWQLASASGKGPATSSTPMPPSGAISPNMLPDKTGAQPSAGPSAPGEDPKSAADKAGAGKAGADQAPAAGNADDFLNQPGATDNFD
jgi:hypothetical protein